MLWYIPPTHPTLNHSGLSKFFIGTSCQVAVSSQDGVVRMWGLPTLIFHATFFPSIFRIHSLTLDIHIRSTTSFLLLLLSSSIHNFHNHPKWKLIPISTNKIAKPLPQVAIGEWCASHHFPFNNGCVVFFFDILLVKEGLKECRLLDNPYPP